MTKKWTRKSALDRMKVNTDLLQVYKHHPLAKLLVDSALKTKPYPGYHRISHYYAYKDWMWAVTDRVDSDSGWICLKVIDDLLPPDDTDSDKEGGSSYATQNPSLPDLPPLPEKEGEGNFFEFKDIKAILAESDEDPRRSEMRKILESLAPTPEPVLVPDLKQEKLQQLEDHLSEIQSLYGDLVMDLKFEEMASSEMQELEELREENERLHKENEELKKKQDPTPNTPNENNALRSSPLTESSIEIIRDWQHAVDLAMLDLTDARKQMERIEKKYKHDPNHHIMVNTYKSFERKKKALEDLLHFTTHDGKQYPGYLNAHWCPDRSFGCYILMND